MASAVPEASWELHLCSWGLGLGMHAAPHFLTSGQVHLGRVCGLEARSLLWPR